MSYLKCFIITLSLALFFVLLIIGVNLCIDNHGVRASLYSRGKDIRRPFYPAHMNAKIFHPEVVFRSPDQYDSFLFGSSRVAGMHVELIPQGRFYNMSFVSGLVSEHLAMVKAFLEKGVKIKAVVIGLDEIYFNPPATAHQKHRLNIMHPDAGGPGRWDIFFTYFFRIPDLLELDLFRDRMIPDGRKGRTLLNPEGVNLGWQEDDRKAGKLKNQYFKFTLRPYHPVTYPETEVHDAFAAIEQLITLSRDHHFSLIFFFNPFSVQLYLDNANALFRIKERLADLTDYYDFSGINVVTTDAGNYVEESHYCYWVGDWIIERMFGTQRFKGPENFGIWVTKESVARHLETQRHDLEQYLKDQRLK